MSKFITGKELIDIIDDIIWDAEQTLLIVSPYVRLDNHFKKLFDKHQKNPKIHLILVFGKNETAVSRSLSKDDFDYFKKFPNISIIYVPNLHAKYYANERKGVVTSINLYDYSFKNNIEFGIFSEQSVLNNITDHFTNNTDKDAWNECTKIVQKNDVVYIKRPVYEHKTFLISLGKTYFESEVLLDYTDYFYNRKNSDYKKRRLDEFPEEVELGTNYGLRPTRTENETEENSKSKTEIRKEAPKNSFQNEPRQQGYCIRTGEPIPFNPNYPLSRYAWKTWNEFANPDYPEKYCHKTGKPSYGRTSFRNPIL